METKSGLRAKTVKATMTTEAMMITEVVEMYTSHRMVKAVSMAKAMDTRELQVITPAKSIISIRNFLILTTYRGLTRSGYSASWTRAMVKI